MHGRWASLRPLGLKICREVLWNSLYAGSFYSQPGLGVAEPQGGNGG